MTAGASYREEVDGGAGRRSTAQLWSPQLRVMADAPAPAGAIAMWKRSAAAAAVARVMGMRTTSVSFTRAYSYSSGTEALEFRTREYAPVSGAWTNIV
jgi:hypothetical protein